jgi:Tfp pilus assembly protein PilV
VQRSHSEKGSTLIEALISMTIFAAGASAAFSMLMMSVATTRTNALDTHAVARATQEREDLRSLQYPAIVTRNAPSDVFNGTTFTVHSDVQTDQPGANMKTVTVTVSWSHNGTPRGYSLSTVYTNING